MIIKSCDDEKLYPIHTELLKIWFPVIIDKTGIDETKPVVFTIKEEQLSNCLNFILHIEYRKNTESYFSEYCNDVPGWWTVVDTQRTIITVPHYRNSLMNRLYQVGKGDTIRYLYEECGCRDNRLVILYSNIETVNEWMEHIQTKAPDNAVDAKTNESCIIA